MKTMIRKISLLVIAICMVSACGESKFIFTGSVEKVIDGLDFPEGPVYAGNDLLFSNCYGMWIGRLTEDGRLDTFSNLSGNELKPNGLYWSADEYLWACEYHKGRILKLNNKGELVKIFDNNGERFSRPNDITFYQGVIYFTDPKSYSKEIKDGRIYTLNPVTEEIRLFADGLAFPNGIAISPDGEKVLVCESAMNRIIVLSMQDPNEREVLINLPGGDPDGIEFFDNQTLFVAHFGSGKLYAVDYHEKVVTDSLELPGKRVTNCVISPNGKYLFITEAESNSLYQTSLAK
jgi:gluconolactonase